jgi:hypothetical protein
MKVGAPAFPKLALVTSVPSYIFDLGRDRAAVQAALACLIDGKGGT